MQITSARYINAAQTLCEILTDDGRTFHQVGPGGEIGDLLAAWIAAGNTPAAYVAPPAPAPSFLARDLIDELTTDDLVAIETAVASSVALRLLWIRLRARGEAPVDTSSDSFAQGWAGLAAALGADRATAIATALKIPN